MTADEILNAVNSSQAAELAMARLAATDNRLDLANAAADLFEAVQAPACEEAEERLSDLELAIAQTVAELNRLAKGTATSIIDMQMSAEHALKFAQRVEDLWRKR